MKLGATDINAVKIGTTDVNKVYLGLNLVWQKVAANLLLDLYPNAAEAYSLIKLRTDYTGSAIRVRRSLDNTEQDIGFVDNELDTVSLLSFADGGDAFVAKWYDQSGGGNDTAQISDSAQPQIVSSGVVVTDNGKPIINYSLGDSLQTSEPVPLGGASELWLFFVLNITETNSLQIVYESSANGLNNTGAFALAIGTPNVFRVYQRNAADDGFSAVNFDCTIGQHLIALNLKGGQASALDTVSLWQDGIQLTALRNVENTTTNTYSDHVHNLGSRNNGSLSFTGGIQFVDLMTGDQSANRAGIESNINSNYNIYWDGSQTGLLDDYPDAEAAYSLRALSSEYTGPAIRVRRSSDNAEQDINLLYDGSLNTGSLLLFVGAGDGFVTTWYDQSGGGGNNAVQTSESAQPQIVSSGSVLTLNNKPAVYSDGTKVLQTTSTNISVADANGNRSAFGTLNIANDSSLLVSYIDGGSNLLYPIGYFNAVMAINVGGGFSDSVNYTLNNDSIFTSIVSNTEVEIWNNSVSDGATARGTITLGTTQISLFARRTNANNLQGFSNEIILYPSDQSANREAIETNINDYYTIY